jgi:argininosuccinate synthase
MIMERIVLGYTGDLETSIAIPWLADRHHAEIIAVALDLGQRTELVAVRERALALGATRCHVIDVRDELVRDYIVPALKAGALRDGAPMPTALSRPLIARKLVDVARMEGAAAIAHGYGPGSRDATRIERAVRALAPFLTLLAPTHTWEMSAAQQIEYARARNIPASVIASGVRVDATLWGRTVEVDQPSAERAVPPDDLFTLTRSPQHCPDQPAYVEIELQAGVPTSANGIEMPLLEMIESLETIAGAHGVGRIDLGAAADATSSRQICEAPAAIVLHVAHAALQSLVTARALDPVVDVVSRSYAELVHDGDWVSATRDALDGFVSAIQPRVTGTVKLELLKGACRAIDRRSSFALAPAASGAAVVASPDRIDRAAAEDLIEDR